MRKEALAQTDPDSPNLADNELSFGVCLPRSFYTICSCLIWRSAKAQRAPFFKLEFQGPTGPLKF